MKISHNLEDGCLYDEEGNFLASSEETLIFEAKGIQDACNLSGVVGEFKHTTYQLWQWATFRGLGTEFVNTHPASKLFAQKIFELTEAFKEK